MPGLSQLVKRGDDYREVSFWLLLLGSWQCLVAPRGKYTVLGAVGTAAFLAFACWNLGVTGHNLPQRSGQFFSD
jgi:hypothetical protein